MPKVRAFSAAGRLRVTVATPSRTSARSSPPAALSRSSIRPCACSRKACNALGLVAVVEEIHEALALEREAARAAECRCARCG